MTFGGCSLRLELRFEGNFGFARVGFGKVGLPEASPLEGDADGGSFGIFEEFAESRDKFVRMFFPHQIIISREY